MKMYEASWELTTLKTMTIEEKIAFWRWVMQYAKVHAQARKHLIAASNYWKQYAAQWSSPYVKQVLTRMGLTAVDIAGIQAQVDADIPPEITSPNRPARSP